MLLSFSHDDMRPMILNGLRELAGEPTSGAWIKRQTIRAFGPMNQKLFWGKSYLSGLTLHLWWKSRTAERFKFGQVTGRGTRVTIRNIGPEIVVVIHATQKMSGMEVHAFAQADGFTNLDAFIDYFVPQTGDVFRGVLFQW